MTANLYIRREGNVTGSAANFHAFIDGTKIGEVANGQVQLFAIPSGSHEIHVKLWTGKSSPLLKIDAATDKTIFLACGIETWGKVFLKEEMSQNTASSQTQVEAASQFSAIQRKVNLDAQIQQGLNWFYLIGGLSIINSLVYLLGIPLMFVVGLGATQFVDGVISAIARGLSKDNQIVVHLIGFSINVVIASLFMVAGTLGRKRHKWAVIVGMILYALDGVIFLLVGGWLAVGFHCLALWNLWRGLQVLSKLHKIENSKTLTEI